MVRGACPLGAAVRLAAAFFLSLCPWTLAGAERAPAGAPRPMFAPSVAPQLGPAVRYAIAGAARLLADQNCRQIFLDFRDASGRTLQRRLEAVGQDGAGFLGEISFANGTGRAPCVPSSRLAFTSPGSRVVYICATRFELMGRRSPTFASQMIIHELLHALGLGENPPDTHEITAQVAQRCRPAALSFLPK